MDDAENDNWSQKAKGEKLMRVMVDTKWPIKAAWTRMTRKEADPKMPRTMPREPIHCAKPIVRKEESSQTKSVPLGSAVHHLLAI